MVRARVAAVDLRWETRLFATVAAVLTVFGIAAVYSAASFQEEALAELVKQFSGAAVGGLLLTICARIDHASKPACWYDGRMKVTIDLSGELYRAVKVEAARTDRSVRDIVDEALEAWLSAAEDAEDRESADEALAEYRREGGASAEGFFGSLAAETKAAYGPDPE